MEELIKRITDSVGIDADQAVSAVGAILSFLQNEGPSDKVSAMIAGIPGAQEAIDSVSDGGLSGMMPGVMGLGSQLMGMGLGMGEIQGVAKETIAFSKESAGEDAVDEVIAAIPGLSQFI